MTQHTSKLHSAIIESLYVEAIALGEEARKVFEQTDIVDNSSSSSAITKLALAREYTRSSTLLMNALAWLLNHKACIDGELSEQELRHYCRLKKPAYLSEKNREISLLPEQMQDLVQRILTFHARIERLDLRAARPVITALRLRRPAHNHEAELIALP